MGSTGEYSDRTEWAVLAFTSEAKAAAHCTLATARAHEIQQALGQSPAGMQHYENNEYDPDMRMDYTGTSYYVLVVPLAHNPGAQDPPQEVPPDAPDFWTVIRDA
jgi:hypothetical protein